MMRVRFTVVFCSLVVAGLALAPAGCKRGNHSHPAAAAGKAAGAKGGPVTVGPEDYVVVRRRTIQTGPRISGSLEPKNQASVRAKIGGSVLGVRVERGEEVKVGQVLARIESHTLRDMVASAKAAVKSAEEQLAVARRQQQRTQALVKGGALAASNLDSAKSAVVAAQAGLEAARSHLTSARSTLGDATVRAPIAGVVSVRQVNEGDVVAPGGLLFTIIDPSSMRLEASVPSDSLSVLGIGKSVEFSVRGYPNQTFTGHIRWISPAADPTTRQISILIDIPNAGGKLVAGLFAEGRVSARSRQGLVVPDKAVDRSGIRPMVTRVRDHIVQHVEVTLGLADDVNERVEITAGVKAGDVLLVRGARDLPGGTSVELNEPAAGSRPAPPRTRPDTSEKPEKPEKLGKPVPGSKSAARR